MLCATWEVLKKNWKYWKTCRKKSWKNLNFKKTGKNKKNNLISKKIMSNNGKHSKKLKQIQNPKIENNQNQKIRGEWKVTFGPRMGKISEICGNENCFPCHSIGILWNYAFLVDYTSVFLLIASRRYTTRYLKIYRRIQQWRSFFHSNTENLKIVYPLKTDCCWSF